MKEKTFNLGNTVYKEGDPDENLYIVMEGEIEVFYKSALFFQIIIK